MIEMFVRTKHKIDKRHEFALVVVNDDAMWVSEQNHGSNYTVILTSLSLLKYSKLLIFINIFFLTFVFIFRFYNFSLFINFVLFSF